MALLHLYGIVFICLLLSTVRSDVDEEQVVKLLERVQLLEDEVVYQKIQIEALQQDKEPKLKQMEPKMEVPTSRSGRFIMDIAEGPVAFTTRIDAYSVPHMKTNDTIIFGHELLDIGDGYDNHTGVFTAPLPGIYMISCSLLDDVSRTAGSNHGTMVHAEIMHEGTPLARVFAHAEASVYRDQGAQTIVVQAQKGERLYVRVIDNQDLGLGGELYSTFSGYLLWQM